jgi:hypothetical protein
MPAHVPVPPRPATPPPATTAAPPAPAAPYIPRQAAPAAPDAPGPTAYPGAAGPGYPLSPVPSAFPPPPPARPAIGVSGRTRARIAAAVALVLGLGLIGGAVAGAVINHGPRPEPPVADGSPEAFVKARTVWRNTPVDQLFPRTLTEQGAGPGGADRSWSRIGVAPPAGCTGALDPLLQKVLAPAGCARLLRATYVDSTSTTVTTVGLLVTSGESATMTALNRRWAAERLGERSDLLPKPVAFPGTQAAAFGDRQRGSWTVQISADQPFVVYAVSGFADGRTVAPQPADKADSSGTTTAGAQVGLGYDATGLASAVDDRAHAAAEAAINPTPAAKKHS